jgi:predicted nucleotidyltransferase
MVKNEIITEREEKIIQKRLKGHSLSQNESNILSKSIRPKLNSIKEINASALLSRLEYNQKGISIEKKITKLVLGNIRDVRVVLVFGSAIQTNYKHYKDIDLLIITKKRIWNPTGKKYDLIAKLSEKGKDIDLNLDIQILDYETFHQEYRKSSSLIYQLKDSKVIYGKLKIPAKAELSKLDLRMKLDWSDIDDTDSDGKEIYQALRNVILVKLLANKIIDNDILRERVYMELGDNIIEKLKNNRVSKSQKRWILQYIKNLSDKTDDEIKRAKWEKIVL